MTPPLRTIFFRDVALAWRNSGLAALAAPAVALFEDRGVEELANTLRPERPAGAALSAEGELEEGAGESAPQGRAASPDMGGTSDMTH